MGDTIWVRFIQEIPNANAESHTKMATTLFALLKEGGRCDSGKTAAELRCGTVCGTQSH